MRHVIILLVSVFTGTTIASAQPHFKFHEPVVPPRALQVMAHRGMQMLAPENSIRAVVACADDYIEWAEIDIRLSKDGKHVVIHDDRLERCTLGTGRVDNFTLEELQEIDAGSKYAQRFRAVRIASLTEMLEASKGKVNLYLDCKNVDPALLVREITDSAMQSQVIVYGSLPLLEQVHSLSKHTIATMTKYKRSMDIQQFMVQANPSAVEIDADDIDKETCLAFHAKGVKVQAKVLGKAWDTPLVWGKMIDMGVDWLQTDDPAGVRFFEARRRLGAFPTMIAFHRGANRYAPENTLKSISEAARLGADYIEIDIRTTRDNQHVLMHDSQLTRTTGSAVPVNVTGLNEMRKLSAGAWFNQASAQERVPTLDKGLKALGPKAAVYLDAKAIDPVALANAIRTGDLFNRHVVYQSLEYCGKLKAIEPRARLLPPLSSLDNLNTVAAIKPFGVDARWGILSSDMISQCHAKGILVFSDALGLNENIIQYRRAISWGIDCIQTDYPLRVLRAFELEAADKNRK